MSLRYALGAVGAVVGFIYGGPAGARWGFAIGSTIGSIVDPGTVKGPSIGDIAQQTAQEGGPRPIVFVRSPPIAGNVIAQGPPVITKVKQGGKGGPKVSSEVVHRTYAIGVCEGPVGGFRRIWRNNVLVYDASGSPILPAEDTAAFLENARFFIGSFDQEASPDLEAVFGAGTTPAMRGTVYMVMADEDLTDLRGAIPQWTFEVSASSEALISNDVLLPWGTGTGAVDPRNADNWHRYSYYLQVCALSGPNASAHIGTWYGGDSFEVGLGSAVIEGNANPWTGAPTGGYSYGPFGWSKNLRTMVPVHSDTPSEAVTLYWHYNYENPDYFQGVTPSAGGGITYCGYPANFSPPLLVETPGRLDWWSPVDSGEVSGTFWAGVWGRVDELTFAAGGNNCTIGSWQRTPDAHIRIERRPRSPVEGTWTPISGSFKCLAVYADNGTDVTQYPLNPILYAGSDDDNSGFWTAAYNAAVSAGDMPTGKTYGVHYPVAVSSAWSGIFTTTDGTVPLSAVVTQICERAGVPSDLIDVSLLQGTSEADEAVVHGMAVTNQYAAAEAIRALGQVYFFDLSPRDGKLVFVPRGGDHVATVTEDEMVDDGQEDVDDKRDDSISVPRVLNLNYYDVDGGLNTDKQTSERAGDRRSIGEASIQSPIILTADQAAQAVVINHKVLVENQKGQLNFGLSDKFIELAVADPIFVQKDGQTIRGRIEQLQILDGYQQYKVAHDRQSSYVSNAEGIPAAPQTPPPSSIVGPTLIVPLDIPILRDADDVVGLSYYVAVAGLTPAWRGALVELSYDGGANYVDSQLAEASATIGQLAATFGDHPQEFPDVVNQLLVVLQTPDAELEDTTLPGMLSRANLAAVGSPAFGWELINFANAAEQSTEGEWLLDYFLRGRKDSNTAQHTAGETFVLLERGILGFIPSSTTDLTRTLTFRATSLGAPTSTGTIVSMVYSGKSQTERHVGYLMIVPIVDSDGTSVRISWQGVGRLGGGGTAIQGARFAGFRVTFDDHVNAPIVIDTSSTEVTQNTSGFAAGTPYPDTYFGRAASSVYIQAPVRIGDYYFGINQSYGENISTPNGSIRKFAAPDFDPLIGGVNVVTVGFILGFVYTGGYFYTAHVASDGSASIVKKIDPADLTTLFTHTASPGEFQGLVTDGAYLYASMSGSQAIRKMSLSVLGTVADLSISDRPGKLTINGTMIFACLRATDQIAIIDAATFTQIGVFNCVQFPIDILATDDLVFVQGTMQLGVYTQDGTEVIIHDEPTSYGGALVFMELAFDGARIFRTTDTGVKFYGGSSGELTLDFPATNFPVGTITPHVVPYHAGGYIDGKYLFGSYDISSYLPPPSGLPLFDLYTELFTALVLAPTVSVAQLNDLTGAGPAIEVTLP